MKNKKLVITLLCICSIITIILISFMICVITGKIKLDKFIFLNSKVSNKLILDKTYDNNFNHIKLKTDSADVYFKHNNSDTVRIVVYGDKDNLSVDIKDNELSIDFKNKKCTFLCFNVVRSKIEIYLPESYENNLLINNSYGDVWIDSFKNSNIEIYEDCGDVEILSGGKIIVDNKYGDIEIGEVNQSLNINADCGDIEIDSVSLMQDSSINNNYGDIKINKTNEIYIDAKTSLGDIEIENNFRKSDIILKIRNSCGDIEVDN